MIEKIVKEGLSFFFLEVGFVFFCRVGILRSFVYWLVGSFGYFFGLFSLGSFYGWVLSFSCCFWGSFFLGWLFVCLLLSFYSLDVFIMGIFIFFFVWFRFLSYFSLFR